MAPRAETAPARDRHAAAQVVEVPTEIATQRLGSAGNAVELCVAALVNRAAAQNGGDGRPFLDGVGPRREQRHRRGAHP
eukprot:3344722-Prymnesium_polylepis.1